MVGMENLVPRWFQQGVHEMADEERHEPPLIATLPEQNPRTYSEEDDYGRIFGEAAVAHAKLRRQIEANAQRESDLSEQCESLQKKVDFLELENAEYRNTIQTLEADKYNKDQVLSRLRQCLDALDVRPPAKRKNGKKDNGINEQSNQS